MSFSLWAVLGGAIDVMAVIAVWAMTVRFVAHRDLAWARVDTDVRHDVAEASAIVAQSSLQVVRVLARVVPMTGLALATLALGQGMQPSGLAALAPGIAIQNATRDGIALMVGGFALAFVFRIIASSLTRMSQATDATLRRLQSR